MAYLPSAAASLYQETGDPRWLDRDYARRMAGPTMAARFRALIASEKLAKAKSARRTDAVFVYLSGLCSTARKNASAKGMPFTLESEWLWRRYTSTNGKCEITGIPFDLDRGPTKRAAYAPSLDRINCKLGYIPENVRIVCQIANLAMNVWGADTLRDFIRKAHANL